MTDPLDLPEGIRRELARECGITPLQLDAILRGERMPVGWIAAKIARAAGVPMRELLRQLDGLHLGSMGDRPRYPPRRGR